MSTPRFALFPACLLLVAALLPGRALAQEEGRGGIDEDRLIELVVANAKAKHRKKWGAELSPAIRTAKDKVRYLRLRRALDGAKISVNFQAATFPECIDFLRDVTGLNIVVSKDLLKAHDETEVKLRLKKVKLKNVLELIVAKVDKDIRYGYRNGVLWFGLSGEHKEKLVLRFYNVSDIVRKLPDFPAPKLGLKGLSWGD